MVVECWKEFGIETSLDARDNPWDLMSLGKYSANLAWTIETWGGHPDLFYFLSSWHSDFYQPSDKRSNGSNSMRWKNPELDRIIESIQKLDFDDEQGIEARARSSQIKLAAAEMPITPLMSYNVFTVCEDHILRRLPEPARPVHRPRAELGQHEVHVHQDHAEGLITEPEGRPDPRRLSLGIVAPAADHRRALTREPPRCLSS